MKKENHSFKIRWITCLEDPFSKERNMIYELPMTGEHILLNKE
jgi:hypothetical protein